MKKIWILVLATILNSSAHAADKKEGKEQKSQTPYSKMVSALELTDEQKPKFRALQKEHSKFLAKQKKIESAEKKKESGTPYYKTRTEKLKELLTRDQLKVWWKYQAGQRAKRENKAQEKK